ncbi:MAG: GAP family protein [Patescibacteria group bacterium]|nr:GAP family protein [Patescibacteria group bacterium]
MTNLNLATVITTAAIDSINPCAIGVLVFMITFLVSVRGSRKRLLSIGLTYISVVYICYFGAGLGLMKILSSVDFLDVIYKLVGLIVIGGGLLDIYDGIVKNPNPLLSIPKNASPKIKHYIKKATIPAAIVLGAFVSLFELPCTGGVYIAILCMLCKTDLTVQGVAYLALYNLIFVFPLIIILFLCAFGLSSAKIESWRKKNRTHIRILIGILMVVLGIFMISDVI